MTEIQTIEGVQKDVSSLEGTTLKKIMSQEKLFVGGRSKCKFEVACIQIKVKIVSKQIQDQGELMNKFVQF